MWFGFIVGIISGWVINRLLINSSCIVFFLFTNFFKLKSIYHIFDAFLTIGSLCAVKYVNPITNVCIIRASREEYEKVWASITMVRSIGNYPVLFNLLDLSGKSKYCMIDILCFSILILLNIMNMNSQNSHEVSSLSLAFYCKFFYDNIGIAKMGCVI